MRIRAHALRRQMGQRILFQDLDLELASGASLALLGASGCGKTTLVQILSGLERPDAGSVFWDEDDLYRLPTARRERLRLETVGWMQQDPYLDPGLSAWENVLLATAFRHLPQAKARAASLMERAGLTACRDLPAVSLSGGQLVRTALVRALVPAPRVLAIDEPTATLDAVTGGRIGDLILSIAAEERLTLILATHDAALAGRCDQRLSLEAA